MSCKPTCHKAISCNDTLELTVGHLQIGELFGIQDFSLADQSDTAERQGHIIRLWKLFQHFEVLIQMLSDRRIGAITTDQDISMVRAVVMASDHDTVLILQERKDLLAQVNAV